MEEGSWPDTLTEIEHVQEETPHGLLHCTDSLFVSPGGLDAALHRLHTAVRSDLNKVAIRSPTRKSPPSSPRDVLGNHYGGQLGGPQHSQSCKPLFSLLTSQSFCDYFQARRKSNSSSHRTPHKDVTQQISQRMFQASSIPPASPSGLKQVLAGLQPVRAAPVVVHQHRCASADAATWKAGLFGSIAGINSSDDRVGSGASLTFRANNVSPARGSVSPDISFLQQTQPWRGAASPVPRVASPQNLLVLRTQALHTPHNVIAASALKNESKSSSPALAGNRQTAGQFTANSSTSQRAQSPYQQQLETAAACTSGITAIRSGSPAVTQLECAVCHRQHPVQQHHGCCHACSSCCCCGSGRGRNGIGTTLAQQQQQRALGAEASSASVASSCHCIKAYKKGWRDAGGSEAAGQQGSRATATKAFPASLMSSADQAAARAVADAAVAEQNTTGLQHASSSDRSSSSWQPQGELPALPGAGEGATLTAVPPRTPGRAEAQQAEQDSSSNSSGPQDQVHLLLHQLAHMQQLLLSQQPPYDPQYLEDLSDQLQQLLAFAEPQHEQLLMRAMSNQQQLLEGQQRVLLGGQQQQQQGACNDASELDDSGANGDWTDAWVAQHPQQALQGRHSKPVSPWAGQLQEVLYSSKSSMEQHQQPHHQQQLQQQFPQQQPYTGGSNSANRSQVPVTADSVAFSQQHFQRQHFQQLQPHLDNISSTNSQRPRVAGAVAVADSSTIHRQQHQQQFYPATGSISSNSSTSHVIQGPMIAAEDSESVRAAVQAVFDEAFAAAGPDQQVEQVVHYMHAPESQPPAAGTDSAYDARGDWSSSGVLVQGPAQVTAKAQLVPGPGMLVRPTSAPDGNSTWTSVTGRLTAGRTIINNATAGAFTPGQSWGDRISQPAAGPTAGIADSSWAGERGSLSSVSAVGQQPLADQQPAATASRHSKCGAPVAAAVSASGLSSPSGRISSTLPGNTTVISHSRPPSATGSDRGYLDSHLSRLSTFSSGSGTLLSTPRGSHRWSVFSGSGVLSPAALEAAGGQGGWQTPVRSAVNGPSAADSSLMKTQLQPAVLYQPSMHTVPGADVTNYAVSSRVSARPSVRFLDAGNDGSGLSNVDPSSLASCSPSQRYMHQPEQQAHEHEQRQLSALGSYNCSISVLSAHGASIANDQNATDSQLLSQPGNSRHTMVAALSNPHIAPSAAWEPEYSNKPAAATAGPQTVAASVAEVAMGPVSAHQNDSCAGSHRVSRMDMDMGLISPMTSGPISSRGSLSSIRSARPSNAGGMPVAVQQQLLQHNPTEGSSRPKVLALPLGTLGVPTPNSERSSNDGTSWKQQQLLMQQQVAAQQQQLRRLHSRSSSFVGSIVSTPRASVVAGPAGLGRFPTFSRAAGGNSTIGTMPTAATAAATIGAAMHIDGVGDLPEQPYSSAAVADRISSSVMESERPKHVAHAGLTGGPFQSSHVANGQLQHGQEPSCQQQQQLQHHPVPDKRRQQLHSTIQPEQQQQQGREQLHVCDKPSAECLADIPAAVELPVGPGSSSSNNGAGDGTASIESSSLVGQWDPQALLQGMLIDRLLRRRQGCILQRVLSAWWRQTAGSAATYQNAEPSWTSALDERDTQGEAQLQQQQRQQPQQQEQQHQHQQEGVKQYIGLPGSQKQHCVSSKQGALAATLNSVVTDVAAQLLSGSDAGSDEVEFTISGQVRLQRSPAKQRPHSASAALDSHKGKSIIRQVRQQNGMAEKAWPGASNNSRGAATSRHEQSTAAADAAVVKGRPSSAAADALAARTGQGLQRALNASPVKGRRHCMTSRTSPASHGSSKSGVSGTLEQHNKAAAAAQTTPLKEALHEVHSMIGAMESICWSNGHPGSSSRPPEACNDSLLSYTRPGSPAAAEQGDRPDHAGQSAKNSPSNSIRRQKPPPDRHKLRGQLHTVQDRLVRLEVKMNQAAAMQEDCDCWESRSSTGRPLLPHKRSPGASGVASSGSQYGASGALAGAQTAVGSDTRWQRAGLFDPRAHVKRQQLVGRMQQELVELQQELVQLRDMMPAAYM